MDIENQLPEAETDDLATALGAAFDHIEAGGEAPADVELEIDQPEALLDEAPAADKPDDDSTDKPAETQAPSDDNADDSQDQADIDDAQPEIDHTQSAPSSWSKDAATKWADLPAEIKAEIHKRESDYHKGIEPYRQGAAIAQEMQKVIAPYAQNIQASGVHPMQAISHLLGVEHTLRNGSPQEKAQKVAEIARDYGIDLQQIQPLPPIDPQTQALIQQNQQLQQFQQNTLQQQNQAVASEIEAFRANPENVHFEAVKDDMAALLQSGRATDLQDAYDKAVWMRPDIRQTLVQQQRTDAQKQAAEQKRRARAKTASGGVRGAANPKATTLNPDASLRDTLNAALDGDL